MTKKRKRPQVELYDHSTYRNNATASVVDYNYRSGVLQLKSRTLKVAPPAQAVEPPEPQDNLPIADDGVVQDIREDDVGVVVRARTRSKRYMNSVSIMFFFDAIHL